MSYQAFMQRDYKTAKELELEALPLHREVGNRLWELIDLQHLGWVSLYLNEVQEALAYCEASLHIQRTVWRKQEFATSLVLLAEIAFRQQDFRRAACLLGAGERLLKRFSLDHYIGMRELLETMISSTQVTLGSEEYETHWDRGAAMTLEEALDFALQRI
jgi:hypothetical protein